MNTLTATYPDGAELEFDVPESWEELTPKQFTAIAHAVYSSDVKSLIVSMCYKILGKKLFKQISDEENMDEMLRGFSFLAEFPVYQKSKFKGFKLFGKRYLGVDDELETMTLRNFGLADSCLYMLNDVKDEKFLTMFCEIAYNRGIFNKVFKVRKDKALALRLNFEALKANLPLRFPFLREAKSADTQPDYHGLIISVSGTIFGTRAQTENEPLFNVLKKLQHDHDTAKKMEQENGRT